jgi:hypothetical protein
MLNQYSIYKSKKRFLKSVSAVACNLEFCLGYKYIKSEVSSVN